MHVTDDYLTRRCCATRWRGDGTSSQSSRTTSTQSGQDFDSTFERVVAKPEFHALSVVAREHFNVADISVAAQVVRLKSAAPDAVFAWATGTAIGTFFHATQDAGLDPPMFTTLANELTSQMNSLGAVVPTNVYFPGDASFAPELAPGPVKRAALEYRTALQAHGVVLDGGPVSAWDAPTIGVEALRKYGTDATAAQIRDFIANFHGAGIMGSYDFRADPQRGTDPSEVLITRWDRSRQQFVAVSTFGGTPLRTR